MGAYLKYISALMLFGSNGVVASHISLSSYEIVFLRTLIGSAFLAALFFLSGGRPRGIKNRRDLLFLAISGIAMGANRMFLYEAYVRVGVSIATLANYCGPVVVMALSPLLLHERLTFLSAAVFFVVLAGMFHVNGGALLAGGLSWGLACGLLSAVMYAFMVIFNKMAEGITGLENAVFQLFFSFLAVAVFVFAKQGPYVPLTAPELVPVVFLGIVNTGVGCYLYFSSIQRLPAGVVAVCGYIEPLSALMFSAIFLHERLTAVQLLGAFLIIGGAAFYSVVCGYRKRTENS
ncbi:MAG: DMT family transporter [Cloacibacillus porcorum]|uniref:DMT family transporter n=1 Tax=Cloacibacillus porcorum TaxID=1197717 RepID=UPI0023F44A1A|nr:DMT family transporter [Cloacibacillus porcorum]MCD7876031.1 DMT family transporter [Cloacibacillus porcorum]